MRCLALLASAFLLAGCAGPVCSQPESLLGLDGGTVACVQSTDCPRPSSILVCADGKDRRAGDCIDCLDTRCVHYVVGPCE